MAGQRNSYGKRSQSHSDYGDKGENKRRNTNNDRDRESFAIGPEDTVYRYLCPIKKIGSIMGRGGEIVKQLRLDTKSKIRIDDAVAGSDERVVTIYSPSEETNTFEDSGNYICPAQDALFRVHNKVVAEELQVDDDLEGSHQVTARLLVSSDQIGCIIGKGGQIVQNIRSESGALIRILKDEHLPRCALNSDELVQISGEPPAVMKALIQIASRIHENPSRSQHILGSSSSYSSGSTAGAPIMRLAPYTSSYGGYRGETGDWSRPYHPPPRGDSSSKEFSLHMVCATENIGAVIGKGGVIINQIRQETRASIKVDSSAAEGDDCLITLSSKEYFEDPISPTIEAAISLQPRCSDKSERDSGLVSFTTRLLVPTSRIGCLIGKGGAIITEIRRLSKANIRILSKESLPKVASPDDEMVQISGELAIARDALIQVATRLRANFFDREGGVPAFMPVLPYLPMPAGQADGYGYEGRDEKRQGHSRSYSGGYEGRSSDYTHGDGYRGYGSPVRGSGYGAYGGYSSGRASPPRSSSGREPAPRDSRRKSYDYRI